MSVAVPIAPRFLAFLALAASLTLDLLFFFGARGSSASFTFFAFDRGAGGGHEPPLTASARTGRGRAASAATVKAASRRARARAIAPLLLRVAQSAPRGTEWCCRPAEPLRQPPTASRPSALARCSDLSQNFYALGPVAARSAHAPTSSRPRVCLLVSYRR
jgi:hypothetical protein